MRMSHQHRNPQQYPRRTRGMSLVELLVGLALGIAVLGMVVKVFVNSRQQFQVADSHARIQENARQAIQYLQDDIRMAGFIGAVQEYWAIQETGNASHTLGPVTGECFTTDTRTFRWVNPFARQTTQIIPPRIYGKDDTRDQFEGCISANNYVNDTDVLSVHYTGTPNVASGAIGNDDETFYLRSNLRGGVVFTCGMGMNGPSMGGNSINNGGVNGMAAGCLQTAVGPSAMLGVLYNSALFWGSIANPDPSPLTTNYPLQAQVYYVRPCTDPGPDDNCGTRDDRDTTPALVRARVDYSANICPDNDPCIVHEPVAEGVVSMQIEYGIDTREAVPVIPNLPGTTNTANFYDGNVNQYVTAVDGNLGANVFDTLPAIALWGRVLTIRIWLLIRSPVIEPSYEGPASYALGEKVVNVDTRFRHQLFTTTAMVRNLTAQ